MQFSDARSADAMRWAPIVPAQQRTSGVLLKRVCWPDEARNSTEGLVVVANWKNYSHQFQSFLWRQSPPRPSQAQSANCVNRRRADKVSFPGLAWKTAGRPQHGSGPGVVWSLSRFGQSALPGALLVHGPRHTPLHWTGKNEEENSAARSLLWRCKWRGKIGHFGRAIDEAILLKLGHCFPISSRTVAHPLTSPGA